jgi:hypothetical protein
MSACVYVGRVERCKDSAEGEPLIIDRGQRVHATARYLAADTM